MVRKRCRAFVAVLREQEIDRLARLVHGTIEIIPLAFNFDVGLVHSPTHPDGTFAPMKRLFQQGTVPDDPALDGGMVQEDPALFHQFFDMAIAQRIHEIPPHTHQNDV